MLGVDPEFCEERQLIVSNGSLISKANANGLMSFGLFSRSWIEINGLHITPDLLAAQCSFEIDGYRARIILPSIDVSTLREDEYGNDRIEFHAWREKDGIRVPQYFDVLAICLEIEVSEEIQLPSQLMNVRNNAYELLLPTEERNLNDMARKYESIADHVFDVWCNVARWKSGNGDIGRPNIKHSRAGTVRLCEISTSKPIWHAGSGFTVSVDKAKPLSNSEWATISQSLLTYQYSPADIDFYFDGSEHLKHGDLARCVIDFAISAELAIRRNLRERLPHELQEAIAERILKSQITDIFPKYGPTVFGVKLWDKISNSTKQTISDLFRRRNLLVHYANSEGLSRAFCETYRQALAEILREQ